jgi:putative restriction endonuclease
MVSEPIRDRRIRLQAFEWLKNQVDLHGDVLPWSLLLHGFEFEGTRVPLLSQQGIFKPKIVSQIPLSIRTSEQGPYDDSFSEEGLLLYRYRGVDPGHRENVGLREAMRHRIPLIYFHGIVKGKYLAVWPVFIVGNNPSALTFTVAVDEARFISEANEKDWEQLRVAEGEKDDARRTYITSLVRIRLHQRSFRERVLRAYQEQCSLCRLKHLELLDAAHIIPDSEPGGEPKVSNGIALCKLHHAAFDRNFLGIRPDYRIEIREDILHETDGPMLQHGLQGLHNIMIQLPRAGSQRPDPVLLNRRYRRFKEAG